MDQPWSVDRLARQVSLSGEQLRAVCVRERGEPPLRHLARRRMQRAATLLLATDDTVEQVGRSVGYANAFAFSAAFRRHCGAPPRDYRQAARRGEQGSQP